MIFTERGMSTESPTRTVRGWCVVTVAGWPFLDTLRELRRDSIRAYNQKWSTSADPDAEYRKDRKDFGVRVVRCTLTTEPER